jgi:hypothetical protein
MSFGSWSGETHRYATNASFAAVDTPVRQM